jgi:hypothetical protein
MTHGPRRLKDDPDFRWETGCDLRDEESQTGQYDFAGIRERLVAAAAAGGNAPNGGQTGPAPARSGWSGPSPLRGLAKPAAGMVAGAMVVAAAYWLGVQLG